MECSVGSVDSLIKFFLFGWIVNIVILLCVAFSWEPKKKYYYFYGLWKLLFGGESVWIEEYFIALIADEESLTLNSLKNITPKSSQIQAAHFPFLVGETVMI